MSFTMNRFLSKITSYFTVLFGLVLLACGGKDSDDAANASNNDSASPLTLHAAFNDFDDLNVTIYLDEDEVVIETNGLPNHTSPYWSNTTDRAITGPGGRQIVTAGVSTNHPLFVAPTATSFDLMSPGNIDDFNGEYSLRVSANPSKANRASSTGLGAIGIAISGAVIYNDQEGPNEPLDNAIGSFDYSAAHTGPQSYHYHLEPKAWSNDNDALVGIIADGFFIYGRKCASTSTYPADLDASGGHTSTTQHTMEEEYHYHIGNEVYLNQYYLLFPGDYQGTANAIR